MQNYKLYTFELTEKGKREYIATLYNRIRKVHYTRNYTIYVEWDRYICPEESIITQEMTDEVTRMIFGGLL